MTRTLTGDGTGYETDYTVPYATARIGKIWPQEFGAANGDADDGAAILKCAEACQAFDRVMEFPPAQYWLKEPLELPAFPLEVRSMNGHRAAYKGQDDTGPTIRASEDFDSNNLYYGLHQYMIHAEGNLTWDGVNLRGEGKGITYGLRIEKTGENDVQREDMDSEVYGCIIADFYDGVKAVGRGISIDSNIITANRQGLVMGWDDDNYINDGDPVYGSGSNTNKFDMLPYGWRANKIHNNRFHIQTTAIVVETAYAEYLIAQITDNVLDQGDRFFDGAGQYLAFGDNTMLHGYAAGGIIYLRKDSGYVGLSGGFLVGQPLDAEQGLAMQDYLIQTQGVENLVINGTFLKNASVAAIRNNGVIQSGSITGVGVRDIQRLFYNQADVNRMAISGVSGELLAGGAIIDGNGYAWNHSRVEGIAHDMDTTLFMDMGRGVNNHWQPFSVTINDDAFYGVPMPRNACIVSVTAQHDALTPAVGNWGAWRLDGGNPNTGTSDSIAQAYGEIVAETANVTPEGGASSSTTADGTMGVFVNDGIFYIENRLGAPANFWINFGG